MIRGGMLSKFFNFFFFEDSPLIGSKYQWIGMKLDESIKLKTEKNSGNL